MWIGAFLVGLLALMPATILSDGAEGDGLVREEILYVSPGDEGGRSGPSPLIVEVLPHAPRDNEYVVIATSGSGRLNLAGWTLTDGEGSWGLPALSVGVGDALLIARNGTALQEDAGLQAQACVVGCNAALTARGSLALRNQGDGLQLLNPEGQLADTFLYGEVSPLSGWAGDPVPALARGAVARRQTDDSGWLDTDTSRDWAWNRTFRLGQSRRLPASFANVPVSPLLSPNDSREGLLDLVHRAHSRIELAGFTLTNAALAQALRDAIGRGVEVQIGVEASPPGGLGSEGEQILGALQSAGARILLMGSHGERAWRRYSLHHAKYMVVDGTWVVVGSENFSPNGYPAAEGNRGWGVAAYSPALAAWFREILREDWDENRSDVRSLPERAQPRESDGDRTKPPTRIPPLPLADVTAFLGPDNAATGQGLLGLLRDAEKVIDVELFYLRWEWEEGLNPLVAELLEASQRGVTVRILLDGRSYNVDGDEDNDEAVGRMNHLATERGVPLEARIFPGDAQGIVKLHNKGVLVDGRRVWVSSMNWNPAGAYANREAALLVDSLEVAKVFQDAFEEDWERGQGRGTPSYLCGPGGNTFLWIVLGSGGAAGAWWWVLRTRKEATNKHPRKTREWRRRSRQPSSPSPRPRSRSTPTARSTGGSTGRAWRPRGRSR